MLKKELSNQLVAILFAARDPVTTRELLDVFRDLSEPELTDALDSLIQEFRNLIPAMEVREILAELGFKSINEIIGRTDLLRQVSKASSNLDDLDLNPLFSIGDPLDGKASINRNNLTCNVASLRKSKKSDHM